MKNIYLLFGSMLVAATLLSGCSSSTTTEDTTAQTVETNMGRGLDLANLDTTVNPCVDFYQYANGGWVKNNPIPAAESAWGSFNELAEKNNKVLRELLSEAASNTSPIREETSAGGVFGSARKASGRLRTNFLDLIVPMIGLFSSPTSAR